MVVFPYQARIGLLNYIQGKKNENKQTLTLDQISKHWNKQQRDPFARLLHLQSSKTIFKKVIRIVKKAPLSQVWAKAIRNIITLLSFNLTAPTLTLPPTNGGTILYKTGKFWPKISLTSAMPTSIIRNWQGWSFTSRVEATWRKAYLVLPRYQQRTTMRLKQMPKS